MEHEHHHHHHSHHHHHHSVNVSSLNKAFVVGVVINVLYIIVEVGAGIYTDSMGLLSDAGHNLGDVASLLLALIAFKLSNVHSNKKYTYGYKKSTILVSLINAAILLVAVGIIITESVRKFITPTPTSGNLIAFIAGIGVFINGITAWLFIKDKDKDLNVKGAYLHMIADALVSVGVVISGIVIHFTGLYVIDPIIGLIVAIVIIFSTWNLLHDSVRLSLDGVPSSIRIEEIEKTIRADEGVLGFHHLHIWAISTTETALTVHIIPNDMNDMEETKIRLKRKLGYCKIHHATLEFESKDSVCDKCSC